MSANNRQQPDTSQPNSIKKEEPLLLEDWWKILLIAYNILLAVLLSWLLIYYVAFSQYELNFSAWKEPTQAPSTESTPNPASDLTSAPQTTQLDSNGCNLRLMVASDDNPEDEIINQSKMEFESKKKECAVLIVRATGHSEKWTLARFDDTGAFRTVTIDDPNHDLSKELKKEPKNERRIVELATSNLGLTHSNQTAQSDIWFDAMLTMILAGGLAGILRNLHGLDIHFYEEKGLPAELQLIYYLRPFAGAILGLFILFIGHLVTGKLSDGANLMWTTLTGRIPYIGIALLAGFASQEFIGRMKAIAEKLFQERYVPMRYQLRNLT